MFRPAPTINRLARLYNNKQWEEYVRGVAAFRAETDTWADKVAGQWADHLNRSRSDSDSRAVSVSV